MIRAHHGIVEPLSGSSYTISAEDIGVYVLDADSVQVRSKMWYIIDALVVRSLFCNKPVEVFLRCTGADAG